MNQKLDLPDTFKQKFAKMNKELYQLLESAEAAWTKPLNQKFSMMLSGTFLYGLLSDENYSAFHNFLN